MAWRCFECGDEYETRVDWCAGCGESNTVYRLGRRARAEIDSVLEAVSADTLVAQAVRPQELPECPGVHCGRSSVVVLVGPPASGKTTLASRVLDGCAGPVAYVSVEEAPGPNVGLRLKRLGIARRDFYVLGWGTVDQIATFVRQRRCVAVAIDSVQLAQWHARELRHLLVTTPGLDLLIAVSQVNKHGEIAGRNELLHEADVVLSVESMNARLVKSRYQEITDGFHVPVLPASEPENQVRREGATVRDLRIVRDANLRSGNTGIGNTPLLESTPGASSGDCERPIAP